MWYVWYLILRSEEAGRPKAREGSADNFFRRREKMKKLTETKCICDECEKRFDFSEVVTIIHGRCDGTKLQEECVSPCCHSIYWTELENEEMQLGF